MIPTSVIWKSVLILSSPKFVKVSLTFYYIFFSIAYTCESIYKGSAWHIWYIRTGTSRPSRYEGKLNMWYGYLSEGRSWITRLDNFSHSLLKKICHISVSANCIIGEFVFVIKLSSWYLRKSQCQKNKSHPPPNNYRPISLLHCIRKFFQYIYNNSYV